MEFECHWLDEISLLIVLCSEFELKPEGRLTVTVVRANDLKNLEMIGKSDPYVVVHIRPRFKVKTKTIDNNLSPVWNETFELIAEDRETQGLTVEVLNHSIYPSFCIQYHCLKLTRACSDIDIEI